MAQAVNDWLAFGLINRDPATLKKNKWLCEKHILPRLGARKLKDLRATEVETLAGPACADA